MGGTLLDIGCGFFSNKFPFGSDVTYVGLDISDRARDVRADAHRLPFADASVDWVLLVGVLEHVDDPDRVLAEARRVLKPGGLGYVAVPFLQMHHAAQDYVRWTRQGFERLLADHDFAIEQMVPNGGFFLVLDYLPHLASVPGCGAAAQSDGVVPAAGQGRFPATRGACALCRLQSVRNVFSCACTQAIMECGGTRTRHVQP